LAVVSTAEDRGGNGDDDCHDRRRLRHRGLRERPSGIPEMRSHSTVMYLTVGRRHAPGLEKAVSESTPLSSAHVFRTAQTRSGESARIVTLIAGGQPDAFAERSFTG
jgi:hypothetical protein